MEWNTLQTTNIYVGQKLKLKGVKTVVNQTPKTPEKPVKTEPISCVPEPTNSIGRDAVGNTIR